MADNKKQSAQEVQNATAKGYEQIALFDMPAPEDETAAAISDITKTILQHEEIRNSPNYKANDLLLKVDEIALLAKRRSRAGTIAIACQSAAEDAAALYKSTGSAQFAEIADKLATLGETLAMQAESEKQVPNTPTKEAAKESIVFCPEHTDPQTGETIPEQEFSLPAQLEEYRKNNPFGASQYEKELAAAEAAEKEPYTIHVNMAGYDPKLDPNSPEFDAEAWRKAVFEPDENGETMLDRTQRIVSESAEKIATAAVNAMPTAEQLSQILQNITDALATSMRDTMQATFDAIESIATFLQSETYQAIKENVSKLTEAIAEHAEEIEAAADETTAESIKPLIPFIKEELEEMKADPAFQDCSIADIIKGGFDADGNPIASPFEKAIARARERKAAFDKAQEITKLTKPLEETVLHSIIPSKSVMPNNALMNHLQQKPAINAGEHDVTVSNSTKNRNEIVTVVQIDYDENETGIKLITPNMTEYERQVTNAICSLWRYGHDSHTFTSDMIYRTMTGQGSGGKATSGQKSAITRFMHKWEAVKITLDFSEEARKRNYTAANGKPVKSVYVRERFLNLREVTVKAGSETVTAWQLKEEPIILKYSELSKQVLSIPSDLLDIKEVQRGLPTTVSISNNDDRIAVKGNLLRRIAILRYRKRNKQEWSSVISFDTVFDETGLQQASKDKRSNMYSYIKQCLDFWKAEKWIAGYSMIKKGKKITGVNISL